MAHNRLLSIIIPVYNAEPFLSACLDGILAAGLTDCELLLIDDGSTDASGAICERYAKSAPDIRVIHQANAGPSAARNRGLRESRGEFIAFFDADDTVESGALRKTVSLLPSYDAQLWASDFSRVAENGCVLDRVWQIEATEAPITAPAYMLRFLSDRAVVWNAVRYIFRRDFLTENGLSFPEGVHCAEDLDFVVRALSRAEKPVFFHNPYYVYRIHHGGTLAQSLTLKRVRDLTDMLRLAESRLSNESSDFSRLMRDKLVREYLMNLSLCAELPAADRPAARACFRETSGLLRGADELGLKAVCLFVRLFGIRFSAWLLYRMKTLKRFLKKRKIERYEVRV